MYIFHLQTTKFKTNIALSAWMVSGGPLGPWPPDARRRLWMIILLTGSMSIKCIIHIQLSSSR